MAEAAKDIIAQPYDVVCTTDNESEWKRLRATGIGASEISVVLGASSWESILDLYFRKVDHQFEDPQADAPDPFVEDEWLLWGRRLEHEIRSELCARAGVKMVQRNVLLRSTAHHWALATPDGLTEAGEPVEAKNIAWGYDPEEWAEQIPEKYYLQVQQQMLVTGAQRALFGALLWGSRLIWEWVPRDERTIARIVAAGSEFWQRVQRAEPPLSDGHPNARRALGRLAVVPQPLEIFEQDIEDKLAVWLEADANLARLRDEERSAKRHRDAAADHVAQHMGAHRKAFTVTGWMFRWESVTRRGFTVATSTHEEFKIEPPKKHKRKRGGKKTKR